MSANLLKDADYFYIFVQISFLMKKLISICAALMCASAVLSAQEAFSHLSMGIEVGTTGAGIELAMPVISNHVVLKAGYNFPSLQRSAVEDFEMDFVNSEIAEINAQLASAGAAERINTNFHDIKVKIAPVLNLSSAKLMLEFYPFKKIGFHVTAGAYMGMTDELIGLDVSTGEQFWSEFQALKEEVAVLDAKYQCGTVAEPKFNLGNSTYQVKARDGEGYLNAALNVAKIRPYLGIGFGKSVPDGRMGLQLDLGVWSHGVPTLQSDNKVAYDSSLESIVDQEYVDLIEDFTFYPQVSIRFIYRIF